MTPVERSADVEESPSDHEERRPLTTLRACRDGSHRLESRQLDIADIAGPFLSVELNGTYM